MSDGVPRCRPCKGTGRIVDDIESYPEGLICLDCDGTGNRWKALLLRAYRTGWGDGVEAQRKAIPIQYISGHERVTHEEIMERITKQDYE